MPRKPNRDKALVAAEKAAQKARGIARREQAQRNREEKEFQKSLRRQKKLDKILFAEEGNIALPAKFRKPLPIPVAKSGPKPLPRLPPGLPAKYRELANRPLPELPIRFIPPVKKVRAPRRSKEVILAEKQAIAERRAERELKKARKASRPKKVLSDKQKIALEMGRQKRKDNIAKNKK